MPPRGHRGRLPGAVTPPGHPLRTHHTQFGRGEFMRTLRRLTCALLVAALAVTFAGPVSAQLADPNSLASSGVLLPFFSDPAAGHVSIFEITSPVVQTVIGINLFNLTNPLHMVF